MIRNIEVHPETDAFTRELTVRRNVAMAKLRDELAAEESAQRERSQNAQKDAAALIPSVAAARPTGEPMLHSQLYEHLVALSHTVGEDGHSKVSDVLSWLAICMCDNPKDTEGQALCDFWFDARKSYERIMREETGSEEARNEDPGAEVSQ